MSIDIQIRELTFANGITSQNALSILCAYNNHTDPYHSHSVVITFICNRKNIPFHVQLYTPVVFQVDIEFLTVLG